MNELALFAGAGGGILGGKLLGWRTVCAVEWEAYPASVLCARQNDKILPTFPIWDDVQTFDGKPWQGIVDVVSGGFPCQDISIAGRGKGLEGEKSSMWFHMARVVSEIRPRFVFVENSPMLIHRGLDRVLADLSSLGYDSKWTIMGAAHVGAVHQRDRLWLVANTRLWGGDFRLAQTRQESSKEWSAHPNQTGRSSEQSKAMAHTSIEDAQRSRKSIGIRKERDTPIGTGWWASEPRVGRVADGVACRVDRLKAIGNGQVPLVAATAWKLLNKRLDGHKQRGMEKHL